MIRITRTPFDPSMLENTFPAGSLEQSILETMKQSPEDYTFESPEELKFELKMRSATVEAARALNRSGMDFAIFRKSTSNPDYWDRTDDGGFRLKAGVRPSEAVRDILINGPKYATECATAIMIVYYLAALKVFPDAAFDKAFPRIRLMNWHSIDPLFQSLGRMRHYAEFLPGDRMYFVNPDVNPETPEWQGENVIVLGDGNYYGHGLGIAGESAIIAALNENRHSGATRPAYLLERSGRPDYLELFHTLQKLTGSGSG